MSDMGPCSTSLWLVGGTRRDELEAPFPMSWEPQKCDGLISILNWPWILESRDGLKSEMSLH